MNIMKKQIENLFTDPQETMGNGLYFSGYENEGEYKMWYNSGQLYEHYFYKDGRLDGEYKRWHKNRQLNKHCFFKYGKLDGEFKRWYDSGRLFKHCFFKDGKEYTIEDAKKKFPEGPWL